jgi:membrane-associated phospholipid phosphatase
MSSMAMRIAQTLILAVALTHLCTQASIAQLNEADTTKSFVKKVADSAAGDIKTPVQPKRLSWKPVIIPAAMIGYGVLEFKLGFLKDVNITGRSWASGNEDPDQKTSVDNYTIFIPAAAVYGLNIAGIKGKNNMVDATLLYAGASAIANAIVFPVKKWTSVTRPDSSAPNSFPSGHTAQAFVSAEFLRQEYKGKYPWITAAGYAVAATTGYLRMYNNKHWFSDVIAGAGIGIMSTRLSYYFYPKLKNAILGKHVKSSTMLVPTYNSGAIGLVMVSQF